MDDRADGRQDPAYVAIGPLQVAIILVLGISLFRVPLRGSLLDAFVASLAFAAATLTLGLLVSIGVSVANLRLARQAGSHRGLVVTGLILMMAVVAG